MANEISTMLSNGVSTQAPQVTLKNEKLTVYTNAIFDLMEKSKRNMFEIAVRLLVISKEKLYEDDNYKDVFDFAFKVLGYKKNFVYKLTTSAEKYIEYGKSEDGGYTSILAHDNKDYTVSQLIELNSIESDTALALNENGVISPEMTTKEIRGVIKDYKNGVIDVKGDGIEHNDIKDNNNDDMKDNNNEINVDDSAIAMVSILNACDTLMKDERLIKDISFMKKVTEFRQLIENYQL